MIVDPADMDLDEVGNPIDYFNIYKRKMQELAHSKFERDKDVMFFNYLDRLVDPKQFEEADRARAKAKGKEVNNLREFVTDKTSLTQEKKRNEQIKRWAEYRQKRIEQGLPADPPDVDPAILKALVDSLKGQGTEVLKQKTFVPKFESVSSDQTGQNEKSYIVAKKYGSNRDFRPPWKDPNPVKYGGAYGMQYMKEMIDTGFQRQKADQIRRESAARRAKMTQFEIEQE